MYHSRETNHRIRLTRDVLGSLALWVNYCNTSPNEGTVRVAKIKWLNWVLWTGPRTHITHSWSAWADWGRVLVCSIFTAFLGRLHTEIISSYTLTFSERISLRFFTFLDSQEFVLSGTWIHDPRIVCMWHSLNPFSLLQLLLRRKTSLRFLVLIKWQS